jgi:hypothetical protein
VLRSIKLAQGVIMRPIPENAAVTIRGRPVQAADLTEELLLGIYTAVWQNMERENALINHRLNWALLLTAAFIPAQAFIAGGIIEAGPEPDARIMQSVACIFMAFMSFGAMRVCATVKDAVEAALNQLSYLKLFYRRSSINDKNIFECYLELPRPFGDSDDHKSGNVASRAVAPALHNLWIFLTVIEFAAGMLFLAIRHVPSPA